MFVCYSEDGTYNIHFVVNGNIILHPIRNDCIIAYSIRSDVYILEEDKIIRISNIEFRHGNYEIEERVETRDVEGIRNICVVYGILCIIYDDHVIVEGSRLDISGVETIIELTDLRIYYSKQNFVWVYSRRTKKCHKYHNSDEYTYKLHNMKYQCVDDCKLYIEGGFFHIETPNKKVYKTEYIDIYSIEHDENIIMVKSTDNVVYITSSYPNFDIKVDILKKFNGYLHPPRQLKSARATH